MIREVMGPNGGLPLLLNNISSNYPQNVYVYAHNLVLFSTLVREASFYTWQGLTADRSAESE